jgi:hypothetical protein
MKFATKRPYADPDKAARKLIEIANTVEAVQDGRIHIEKINWPFLQAGGSPDEYVTGLQTAMDRGREVHAGGRRYLLVSQGAGNDRSRTRFLCRTGSGSSPLPPTTSPSFRRPSTKRQSGRRRWNA